MTEPTQSDASTDVTSTTSFTDYARAAVLGVFMLGIFIAIRWAGVERLQALVAQAGPFAPFFYMFLRGGATVVAPLSSGPLQLASGILFGFVPAVIYSVVASTLGYSVSFWLARRYGREVVRRLVGDRLDQVDEYVERLNGLRNLITARLALYFAYDFVAYAAGLSQVKFWLFVVVTFVLGIIPTAAVIGTGLFFAGGFDGWAWLPF